ncbi:MAG: aldo/keto reductase [Gammaproteobacteria bacterium]|nr:aldo/keto reductase [Gammaproteobacteria bacterium]
MVELALGTAQFGMNYGIAGRGEKVPSHEVKQIFAKAWALGIRTLDTAQAYGTIEADLLEYMEDHPFSIISKIPGLSVPLNQSNAVKEYINETIDKTISRLGKQLKTILFHQTTDLLSEFGHDVWQAAQKAVDDTDIQLGVSCYSFDELRLLCERYPLSAVQIPGNAFDQCFINEDGFDNVTIDVRSVFLQGLLLLSTHEVGVRLPKAVPAILAWQAFCETHGLSALQAALSIVKASPRLRYCIVGVDCVSQLESIVEAWSGCTALHAPTLAMRDPSIIDPRCWPK